MESRQNRFGVDVLSEAGSLESGCGVNNMKDGLVIYVHNVNVDLCIKLVTFCSDGDSETYWTGLNSLAGIAAACQTFKNFYSGSVCLF